MLVVSTTLFGAGACRGLVGVPTSTGAPVAARRSAPGATPLARWPIKTSQHVDVWLHAFAMLTEDTLIVPTFRAGYRDSLTVIKNRANVLTSLDTYRALLAKRLAATPSYVQAQSLAFEFDSWDSLRVECERFVLADGDSKRVTARAPVEHMVQLARAFPTATDREWLRLFVAGVQDEQTRFFSAEYQRVLRSRHATITAVDSLWQQVYRGRFDRFMTTTGQRSGDVLLSTPLGGAGRAARGPERQRVLAVPFPARVQDANEVILVIAHELTTALTASVMTGGPATAERRPVATNRALVVPQVRAGAMLLERVAPELVDSYMRFYLQQAGVRADAAAARLQFERVFDISVGLRDELRRQVDVAAGVH